MAIVAIYRRAPKTDKLIHNAKPTQNGKPTQTGEPNHNGKPTQTSEPNHNGKPTPISELTQTSELTHTSELTQASELTQTSELPEPSAAQSKGRTPPTNSTRRALAITGLGGLLIAGVTVITTSGSETAPSANGHGSAAFDNARTGDCLSWPKNSPDQAHLVDCNAEHLFEVAQAGAISDSQQGCQLAVQRYLGSRYDPNGKFAIGVLRPGDTAGSHSAGQRLLCGLQLTGSDKQPVAFKGKIAELDQSRVWPSGTCLAIDPSSDLADITVGCSAPHAQEITGAVNLAAVWPDTPPSQPDQDAVIRDACTRATDAYLSPVALPTTGLTLIYSTVPLPSWLAGSRQVSCGIGAPLGDRAWATLSGSAKDRLLINGVAAGANVVAAGALPAAPPQAAPDRRPDTTSTAASSPNPAPSTTAGPPASTTASPAPTPSPAPPANASPPLPANPGPPLPANASPPLPANPGPPQPANPDPPLPPNPGTPLTPNPGPPLPANPDPPLPPNPGPPLPPNAGPPLPPNASPSPSATPDADAPQVIEIPGLPPITLPRLLPPAPPPPGD